MRRILFMLLGGLALITLELVTSPGVNAAGGPPIGPQFGGAGVTAPSITWNYVTLNTNRGTVVEQVQRGSGAVYSYNLLPEQLGVQGATTDGAATGLSADTRTLVLVELRNQYPSRRTDLLVLDVRHMSVRYRISLAGYFTIDAVSPTGRWLYLVHYRSTTDTTDYQVQAYDLARRLLLARPVVDPREPEEKMRGTPFTRAMSLNGRWVYTLYDRGTQAPFIHALDTVGRRAFCLDLPTLAGQDTSRLRLVLTPGALLVERGRTQVSTVNTRTLAVRAASSRHAVRRPSALWALLILPAALLLIAVPLARRRIHQHRRRRAHAERLDPAGERDRHEQVAH